MNQTFQAKLQAVDASLLTPLVQQVLDDPLAEVMDWQQRPLLGGRETEESGVLGCIRFSGHARLLDKVVPWTLVLKAFSPPPRDANNQQTASAFYWKREALVYQSGLLNELRGGLVAPRFYAVVEYPDEEVWVWMEYIVEESKQWSLERFGLAARHLGQFNGNSLVQGPLPTYPWLSNHLIQEWLRMTELGEMELLRLAQHSRSWVTPRSAERMLRLYDQRERLLAVLDQLPQVLCHHDAHRRNLMARRTAAGEEQTVAIDWAAVGRAAIGEEIAILVTSTLPEIPAVDAPQLEDLVSAGYLAGLREAGWQGDDTVTRLGYALALALFNVAAHSFFVRQVENEEFVRFEEKHMGRPFHVLVQQFRSSLEFCLDRGDVALALL